MTEYPVPGVTGPNWGQQLVDAVRADVAAAILPPVDRFDVTRMSRFKTALANAAAAPCDVLVVGDSTSEGYGATSTATRWCNVLVDRLRTRAGLSGGEGYVPAFYEDATKADRWTGGTFTTSGSLFGLGLRCIRLTAGTSSFTFTGTGVDVMFAVGPAAGKFTWNIDGGTESAENATYSASTQGGWCYISARGLAAGPHTVHITWKSATVYIEGAMVYNGDETKGIRLVEAAHSSYQAFSFGTWSNLWGPSITPRGVPWAVPTASVTARVDPALAVIMLGLNDWASNALPRRTATQLLGDLKAIIATIRANTVVDPSILLVIPWERTTTTPDPVNNPLKATWDEYRAAYYQCAADDENVSVLDLKPVIGTFTTGDPYDLDANDGLHLNDKGYRTVANRALGVLVAP